MTGDIEFNPLCNLLQMRRQRCLKGTCPITPPASRCLNQDLNPGLLEPVHIGGPVGGPSVGVEAAAPGPEQATQFPEGRWEGPALVTTPPTQLSPSACQKGDMAWLDPVTCQILISLSGIIVPAIIKLLPVSAAPASHSGSSCALRGTSSTPTSLTLSRLPKEGRHRLRTHRTPRGRKHVASVISFNCPQRSLKAPRLLQHLHPLCLPAPLLAALPPGSASGAG